jgi:hypothetical protein
MQSMAAIHRPTAACPSITSHWKLRATLMKVTDTTCKCKQEDVMHYNSIDLLHYR